MDHHRAQTILTASGVLVVSGYAVLGALAMGLWEPVAGSGLPIAETREAMTLAGESLSDVPGIIFAVAGIALAATWAFVSLREPRRRLSTSASGYSILLVLGAPAYFYLSFGNMNSVGDAFPDWHPEAALAVALPFYLVGVVALVASVALLVFEALGPRRPALRKP